MLRDKIVRWHIKLSRYIGAVDAGTATDDDFREIVRYCWDEGIFLMVALVLGAIAYLIWTIIYYII